MNMVLLRLQPMFFFYRFHVTAAADTVKKTSLKLPSCPSKQQKNNLVSMFSREADNILVSHFNYNSSAIKKRKKALIFCFSQHFDPYNLLIKYNLWLYDNKLIF